MQGLTIKKKKKGLIQVWISQWDGVQRFYYSNQVSFSSIFLALGVSNNGLRIHVNSTTAFGQ